MVLANALGARLRTLRVRAGLSATALAGDALSVATISRIEHGAMDPSLTTLRYLADRLQCSVADLLDEGEDISRLQDVLTQAESWLLLGVPLRALEVCRSAFDDAEQPAFGEPAAHRALRRVRWAALRAQALLDPEGAAALDEAIREAMATADVWAVAQLVAARTESLESDQAAPLLQRALAGLPVARDDPLDCQVARGSLMAALARRHEATGASETARALYTHVATACAIFQRPEMAARLLLEPSVPLAGAQPKPTGQRRFYETIQSGKRAPNLTAAALSARRASPNAHVMDRRDVQQSALFLLSVVVAGSRLWRRVTLDLARLDVQARRLADAARHLHSVQSANAALDATTLGGFWSELERHLDAQERDAGPTLPALVERVTPAGGAVQFTEEALRIETALRAGRPQEAEQIGAILAGALAGGSPAVAQTIWLRLALAWAEAGNAPRAARALRAAIAMQQ